MMNNYYLLKIMALPAILFALPSFGMQITYQYKNQEKSGLARVMRQDLSELILISSNQPKQRYWEEKAEESNQSEQLYLNEKAKEIDPQEQSGLVKVMRQDPSELILVHSDKPGRLHLRGTCHALYEQIKIDEIEEARKSLAGKTRIFAMGNFHRLHYYKYLDGYLTRDLAEKLKLKYDQDDFLPNGDLNSNYDLSESYYEKRLVLNLFSYLHNNRTELLKQEYQDFKKLYTFAGITEGENSEKQKSLVRAQYYFSKANAIDRIKDTNDLFEMHHRYQGRDYDKFESVFMDTVKLALSLQDWNFAKGLIQTNPYGICDKQNFRKKLLEDKPYYICHIHGFTEEFIKKHSSYDFNQYDGYFRHSFTIEQLLINQKEHSDVAKILELLKPQACHTEKQYRYCTIL